MLFTFNSYRKLLETIAANDFPIVGIEEYLADRHAGIKPPDKFLAIRHDVDYFPTRAVTMAEIEKEMGIATTYYVRRHFFDDKLDLVKKIADFGHQIGYHYEEIDTHQKAPNMQIGRDAVGFFIGSLLDLDKLGFPIKTICAHGNPLTDVDNRQVVHLVRDEGFLDKLAFTYDKDIVREKVSKQLLGDASLDITGDDFDLYLPDTGRFNPRFNLKDRIDNCRISGLNGLAEFDRILKEGRNRRVYMNMHPDRWSGNAAVWLFDFAFDTAKNTAKRFMGKSNYAGKMVGTDARKHHQSVLKSMGEKPDERPRSGS